MRHSRLMERAVKSGLYNVVDRAVIGHNCLCRILGRIANSANVPAELEADLQDLENLLCGHRKYSVRLKRVYDEALRHRTRRKTPKGERKQ